jgi:DNA-binding PadR family transcriptional regulator
MSPVFRHGGLRLYLLKLLDEAPRHGYDVIRLLQDRFLGVYSPSPGTIYPRLARLEEEGLVTHEVIDGKKVYKITDAGREELNGRLDDLADLEDELSASVRDIAREITRDVRETVRSLRDEFTWAVREAGRTGQDGGRRDRTASGGGYVSADQAQAEADEAQARADQAQAEADQAQAQAEQAQAQAEQAQAQAEQAQAQAEQAQAQAEQAHAESDGTQAAADEAEAAAAQSKPAGAGTDSVWTKAAGEAQPGARDTGDSGPARDRSGRDDESARRESQPRWPSGGWRDWADWAERRDWRAWADWAEQRDWREWAGKQEWKDRAKASQKEWKEWAKASKQEWAASRGGARGLRDADRELVVDLERLAAAFARELRGVAWQAEALSEDAVGNLGRILTDALNRIRNEVFRPPGARETPGARGAPGAAEAPGAPGSGTEES